MAIERTFSIIKPDATKRNLTGAINAVIEKAGLRIVAQKGCAGRGPGGEVLRGTQARPFYGELCDFMTSVRSSCRYSKAIMPSRSIAK